MRKLGTIDLEILHLAMGKNGTFNENDLENSELKRLGVGKILDSLASLKDRNMISLNNDGSFSITELAKEILWSKDIPTWAKILRILQIKSCKIEQIADILRMSKTTIIEDLERLRKKQFILMSPQRQDNKIARVYEILPDGIDEIDKTEVKGFDKTDFGEFKPKIETLSIIEEIINEIQDMQIEQSKKDNIITKLSKLKNKLEI
ncbi:MAG: transcriptional regulator [Nitrosopumilus sp.]|nr:transcriptional regulator [Nitrosopumilus sp.]MDH3766115.1 transcriptional regulator [Nitrosopumilus sp.]